jgi:DNA segregation ATPase FtsK/SpoIIIE, S-DNA-T family
MTTQPTPDHPDGQERPQLRALPGGEIPTDGQDSSPAVYADVTASAERKPILPPWLASLDGVKHHARRAGGYAWHAARFHGLRSPVYLAQALFWAQVGTVRLLLRWLHWWLVPVPLEVYQDAIADGHRHRHRTHAVHRETSKTRALISLAVLGAAWIGGMLAWVHSPRWVWLAAAVGALPVLARFGRGSHRIVQPARVPVAAEALTQDVIVRALGSLSIAKIDAWLRDGNEIMFTGPVRQDGPGWWAELDLPFGVDATEIIERRARLASGLRAPSAPYGRSRSLPSTRGGWSCGSAGRTSPRRKRPHGRC